jgi:long-chain fatty acid transport protein
MYNQKLLPVAIGLTLIATNPAYATNGDQMIGVTAMQWGMGGAAIAAPQDAGTILTNPAGIAELGMKEMRVDMGFGFLNPPRKANGFESDSDLYMIPSGAIAFNVNDRLYLGMGMAGLSGMGVDFPDTNAAAGNQAIVTTKQFYKTAGLIYKPSDKMQIGASWVSEQEMNAFKWNTTAGQIEMTMNGPQQISLGVALRPMPGLLVEADVKHIAFSDVLGSVPVSRPVGYTGAVPAAMNFGWDDQTVFSVGIQKELDSKTSVRMGINYGKSPIGPEDVDSNIGSLAVTEKHLSFGVSRKLSDKATASLSYMHAFHNKVASSTNVIELEQNIINVQVSYAF